MRSSMPSGAPEGPARQPPPAPIPGSVLAGAPWQKQLFWQGFRRAAVAHALLAIVLVIISLRAETRPVVISPSIRVDLIDLPDLTKKDLSNRAYSDLEELTKAMGKASRESKRLLEEIQSEPLDDEMTAKEKKPRPADEPKEEKKTDKKKTKESLRAAIDRIRALQEIEEEVDRTKLKPANLAKGNILSKGSQLTGETGLTSDEYGEKVRSKLSANWDLPIWLAQQKLASQVMVFLDKTGYVSNTIFLKSSGNTQFDEYVLKTIRVSQPFGPPPRELVGEGITLGFPL